MSPPIASIRRRTFEETASSGRRTDYASRNAQVKEQRFYVQSGGLGQCLLYRVVSVLDAPRTGLSQRGKGALSGTGAAFTRSQ